MKNKKVVITGGTGYLAQMLAKRWGHENNVILLTSGREGINNNFNNSLEVAKDSSNLKYCKWDMKAINTQWASELENADLLLNLAGKTVNCRYTEKNKKEVLWSRLNTTTLLGKALEKCIHPPKLWMNMSSATIYSHSTDRPQNEISGKISPLKKDNMPFSFLDRIRFSLKKINRAIKYGTQHNLVKEMENDFSVSVCRKWEESFFKFNTPRTRKLALRTAIVIGNGAVYAACKDLAQKGIGGSQGSGKQKFSWIHEEDFARAIEWLLEQREIEGAINIVAPKVSTNEEWMQLVRKSVGVNWGIHLPTWLLELGAWLRGTETELILKSRWVEPYLLIKSGFKFKYPSLTEAITSISGRNLC